MDSTSAQNKDFQEHSISSAHGGPRESPHSQEGREHGRGSSAVGAGDEYDPVSGNLRPVSGLAEQDAGHLLASDGECGDSLRGTGEDEFVEESQSGYKKRRREGIRPTITGKTRGTI